MKTNFNEAAAFHLAIGVLGDPDVPVGRHELGGCRLVIDFPADSCVERPEGTAKLGRDYTSPKPSDPSMNAVLLFLQRNGKKLAEPKAIKLWKECIAAAAVLPKGTELLPTEARAAIKTITEAAKLCDSPTKATPATRAGHKQAVVRIEEASTPEPAPA